MRIKKIIKLLKRALENESNLYTKDQLDYMKVELKKIETQYEMLVHKDYRGFGKK